MENWPDIKVNIKVNDMRDDLNNLVLEKEKIDKEKYAKVKQAAQEFLEEIEKVRQSKLKEQQQQRKFFDEYCSWKAIDDIYKSEKESNRFLRFLKKLFVDPVISFIEWVGGKING